MSPYDSTEVEDQDQAVVTNIQIHFFLADTSTLGAEDRPLG